MRTALRLAVLAGVFALFALPGAAQPDESAIGLWAYRANFPVGLKGELTLSHRGAHWHASIGGATADADASGNDVRLTFANGGGAFRGTLEHGALTGFWLRRPVTDDPRYPFGEALSYAGPLALHAASPGRWRATVAPLEDTFTLYLKIFRDQDGALKAAFRNPEQNSHGPAMWFSVTPEGDVLHFSAQLDNKPEIRFDAKRLHAPERIAVFWDDMKQTLELSPIAPAQADRFFPRLPGTAPYVYRQPPVTGDGWKTARAGDLGIDEKALAAIVQRIADVDPTSVRPWMIHSMAIAYRGRLVLDEYFYGYGRDEPHDTRSASKSFSSVMLGALMMGGAAISPETKVYDLMAPLGPFANPDPRKAKMTLGHLLTHSAGYACDDNADVSPGNEDGIESDRARSDWAKVTLDLPMQYEPGAHYAYCSMNINLAGAMLARASGEWLPALFDRTVARPLQFGPYYWNLMPNGEGYLGGGVFVRSRDFLKLGQTFLDGGVWNGRRIVSADWVKLSTGPHMHISPATTGLSGDAFNNNYYETDDGYAWHLINVKSGDRVYPAYHANGNGGQLLIVVPQFDLVVMFTAGNYQQGLWNRERDDIVGGMIIPALPTGHAPSHP
jgi:CubicO group peptidase (beta-lactamase class C family)